MRRWLSSVFGMMASAEHPSCDRSHDSEPKTRTVKTKPAALPDLLAAGSRLETSDNERLALRFSTRPADTRKVETGNVTGFQSVAGREALVTSMVTTPQAVGRWLPNRGSQAGSHLTGCLAMVSAATVSGRYQSRRVFQADTFQDVSSPLPLRWAICTDVGLIVRPASILWPCCGIGGR